MSILIYKGFRVRWQIKEKSISKYKLKSIQGLYIYNPLKYVAAYATHGITTINGNFKFKGDVYINTLGLIIEADPNAEWEEITQRLSDLFKYVRSLSMQYDINHTSFLSIHEQKDAIRKKKNTFEETKEFGTWEYRHVTNLKWADFVKIDKAKSKGVLISIYREIFLDAVSAHFDYDYRKSILYFCMACETVVSAKLHERYEELKKKGKLKYTVSDSGLTKDPIYEILRTNKWQFKFKIHEHSLCLFDKSLKIDDQKLYDNLVKLYNTRNKIVHEGEIKLAKSNLLTIDKLGSNEAFDFTIDLFSWLGDKSLEIFKRRKFILVK